MKIKFTHRGQVWVADLKHGKSIAMTLRNGTNNAHCFWAPPPEFSPYQSGDFIGSLEAGAPVNFYNVKFNPHGNGTHTECLGHVVKGEYYISKCLREHHLFAKLVTIWPTTQENGDRVITKAQLEECITYEEVDALVIRTMPNGSNKLNQNYSSTNPPYMEAAGATYLKDMDIQHLLIDLPSIDREEDAGALAAHHAWWNTSANARLDATITELIHVPDHISDGYYLLNLQVAHFELDAAPSHPILYALMQL